MVLPARRYSSVEGSARDHSPLTMHSPKNERFSDAYENERLPPRFDDRLTVEIQHGDANERPHVVIRDVTQDNAWLTAAVDNVCSLPECR